MLCSIYTMEKYWEEAVGKISSLFVECASSWKTKNIEFKKKKQLILEHVSSS